jgi:sigma-B regulation protein RsbU (phosphoserine phosphatase)
MELAKQIQANLLPRVAPDLAGYEFFGRSTPSWQVGGDLYGYWQPRADRFFGAIADVAGKGVGPGLLMACLVAYMNGSTKMNPTTADLATWLSRDLAGHTSKNRFATAFLFCLDPQQHWVDYTNAGHNPALLLRATGEITHLESQGLPLALFPGQNPYGQARFSLDPGDLLFLYTDGINEASNPAGDEFGLERLENVLRASVGLPLEEMVQLLDRSTEQHTHGHPFGDDRTILVLRRI